MDTSSIKIGICSLAYRDKRIVDTISDAFNKCFDEKNIYTSIDIQDSHHHKLTSFSERDRVNYQPWDDYFGFAKKRANMLGSIDSDDYCLLISPATKFVDGWDYMLREWISEHDKNSVLSFKDNIFSTNGSFIKRSVIDSIQYPDYLRLMGEEQDVSIKLYAKGFKVFGGIDNIIQLGEEKELDYIPFSKTHNYDQVVSLYENAKNNFIDLTDYKEKCLEYSNMYPIKKIHHQLNDVEYSSVNMNKLEDERFYNHGSRI